MLFKSKLLHNLFFLFVSLCFLSNVRAQSKIEKSSNKFNLISAEGEIIDHDCDHIFNVSNDKIEAFVSVKDATHTYWRIHDGKWRCFYQCKLVTKDMREDEDEAFEVYYEAIDTNASWVNIYQSTRKENEFIGVDEDLVFIYDLKGKFSLPLSYFQCLESAIDFRNSAAYFSAKYFQMITHRNGKMGLTHLRKKPDIPFVYDAIYEINLHWRNPKYYRYPGYYMAYRQDRGVWHFYDRNFKIIDSLQFNGESEFVSETDTLLIFSNGTEVHAFNPRYKKFEPGYFKDNEVNVIARYCPRIRGVVNDEGQVVIPFDKYYIQTETIGGKEYIFVADIKYLAVLTFSGKELWRVDGRCGIDTKGVGTGPYYFDLSVERQHGIVKIDGEKIEVLIKPAYKSIDLLFNEKKGTIGTAHTENESYKLYTDGSVKLIKN